MVQLVFISFPATKVFPSSLMMMMMMMKTMRMKIMRMKIMMIMIMMLMMMTIMMMMTVPPQKFPRLSLDCTILLQHCQ